MTRGIWIVGITCKHGGYTALLRKGLDLDFGIGYRSLTSMQNALRYGDPEGPLSVYERITLFYGLAQYDAS